MEVDAKIVRKCDIYDAKWTLVRQVSFFIRLVRFYASTCRKDANSASTITLGRLDQSLKA